LNREDELKRILVGFCFFLLSLCGFSQQNAENTFVINIEVPVRVFEGRHFVENLTIEDFELSENGIPQKIEAVYLVKKRTVERSDEKKRFSPSTNRIFFLVFEISEYTSEIGDAIDYFHQNVLSPGDRIVIITPMKTYRLKERVLEYLTPQQMSDQLKEILRKEALIGNAEYRDAIDELVGIAKSLSANSAGDSNDQAQQLDEYTVAGFGRMPLEKQIMKYKNTLDRIRKLRRIDQQKLLYFAETLKKESGQKVVFLIYQREYLPQVEPSIMDKFTAQYQDKPQIIRGLYDISETSRRDIPFDVDLVKKAYSDSSVSVHFLFLTPPVKYVSGVYFQERSEDIYSAFKEIATATGGFFESSANPTACLKDAIHSSENYYLLYYSPKNYEKDGRFKKISVRVKESDYKIIHRMGYIAN
jgi:hypothetical protein